MFLPCDAHFATLTLCWWSVESVVSSVGGDWRQSRPGTNVTLPDVLKKCSESLTELTALFFPCEDMTFSYDHHEQRQQLTSIGRCLPLAVNKSAPIVVAFVKSLITHSGEK